MPYIKNNDREKFRRILGIIKATPPENAGELNYLITKLCHLYVEAKGERYQQYNDVLGALEGVKAELYRRKIAPYEDKKIKENGDV